MRRRYGLRRTAAIASPAVRLTLLRHATLRLEIGGRALLVDPMFDAPGARAPVRGTPAERPNPLVPLPVSVREAVAGIDAAVVSHTHVDHLDAAGVTALIALGLPVFCQPEDLGDLGQLGLDLRPVPAGGSVEWEGLAIHRTGGRHGRDEAMVRSLGAVSGFVVAVDREPTVYLAGDTVWCPEVAAAIEAHRPDWIVVNAGGARFLEGGTVTMEAADVVAVTEAAPAAQVVAVHMEAINHCLETRADLAAALASAGADVRVAIPADGETL
jgi:L-ascorbate metabolism protein UlaG (beta-lactamase superfamily)